jgi:hypothetical protein
MLKKVISTAVKCTKKIGKFLSPTQAKPRKVNHCAKWATFTYNGKKHIQNTNIKVAVVRKNTLNKNLKSLERDCIFHKAQEMNYGIENHIDSHNTIIEVLCQYRGRTQ